MALPAVFEGGPFDGYEEHLDHLPPVIVFDKIMSWPGDMVATLAPKGDDTPTARYQRKGLIRAGRHVYEYTPLEPV